MQTLAQKKVLQDSIKPRERVETVTEADSLRRELRHWQRLTVITVCVMLALAYAVSSMRDQITELTEHNATLQDELNIKRAYDDSWTCTYDRKDKRSAQGIIKSCIRTEGF